MKKLFGMTLGGLQRKAISLVLIVLVIAVGFLAAISGYQTYKLSRIVSRTRDEQQEAISQASGSTVRQVLESSLIQTTTLEADAEDRDIAEIVTEIRILQSMAQDMFGHSESFANVEQHLPDASLDGTPSAMVLFEEGVDYTQSSLLNTASNLTVPMMVMMRNSDKIDSIYIGLADGTDLCVDDESANKLDENGDPIPFPVRERPWYTGAVETGDVYFTGVIPDAFSDAVSVTCSAPIVTNGELIGVVGIDILLDRMDDFLNSVSSEGGSVFIINDQHQVLLSSDETGVFAVSTNNTLADLDDLGNLGNADMISFMDQALEETTDLNVIMLGGREYYMAGSPMPTVGWAVIAVVDKELTEQPTAALLAEYDAINAAASEEFRQSTRISNITSVVGIVAVFLLGAWIALMMTKRMVRPIEEMTADIMASETGGHIFEMKDSYRTDDEIEVLAESFEDLSKKTRKYIKDITEITREKERVSTELTMATRIQSSMLPHIYPAFPDRSEFDVYASMDPAKEVGGDFYDFFLIDDDHLCLVMADVSGKGIPAALFMMISKTILKNCAMMWTSPGEILEMTNDALCMDNQVDMFVTVWLGILEISTGKVTAANAGHEFPVIRHPDGGFELMKDKHGLVLGAMRGMRYTEYDFTLEKGAKLFLYTDGVPEATDAEGKRFGTDRMLAALNAHTDDDPMQTLKNVRAAVDGFVMEAEQFDDLTMLCLEYKGKEEQEDDH
ncbi:MAG: SpoIIE family protein phosphatase [Lachnospiraceae bacterium]|nr:SpoIIE family protein phosphatase [Lachnospiraceae bacterium]